jgi:hypothetical protein
MIDKSAQSNGECALKIRTYISNIQGRGGTKIPQLEGRTYDSDMIILNEINSRPGDEQSIGLGCRLVAISDGGEKNKTKGFGTAVMSRIYNPETDSIVFKSSDREICTVRRCVSKGVYMSIIGGYCSPNDPAELVKLFMKQIDEQVKLAVEVRKDSIVIRVGNRAKNPWHGTARHGTEGHGTARLFLPCQK